MAYQIQFDREVDGQMRSLTARQRAIVVDSTMRYLRDQPTLASRNRKALQPNIIATWELRVADLRLYYDVFEEPDAVVRIMAVGLKIRNRVLIGGEDVQI